MKSLVKTSSILSFIGVATLLSYFALAAEKVKIRQQVLSQIEKYDGPHLVYQHDQKVTLIRAVEENQQMQLKTSELNKPGHISVFKPGLHPITFQVPLKQDIQPPPSVYPKPEKIFAISDVEGNFNTVTGLLKAHKIIDQQLNWQFNKGHLVIIGDVFDRGNHVTELLWLLYKLEDQAKVQGGMVHMLIGNHEMMVLQNDLRYAEEKYLKFERLLKQQTNLNYVDLFRENTELGRWLRSKNVVERIGDTLFTHGGMSIKMPEHKLSLDKINATIRTGIDTKKKQRNERQKLLFGRNGPMWYRGYFMPIPNSPMIDDEKLATVLNYYGAKAIAVGHTIVDKPTLKFGGKVIAVDVKHPADHLDTEPKRISYGVLIEGDKVYRVDENGGKERI